MPKIAENKPQSIQMTLFDYFMDVDSFTLAEATECVKMAKQEIKTPSIRARIYEGIDKGLFDRVDKGIYTIKKKNEMGMESTCLFINGDGRDLSVFADESIDAIITDHPYKLDKALKGGNRDFTAYENFQYNQQDFHTKARVMKYGCFVVEFLPEENNQNYEYIYQIKEMAKKAGLEYYATVPWKKGDFVANTGRKAKNTENVVFFVKGIARNLRLDMKKICAVVPKAEILTYKNENLDMVPNEDGEFDAIYADLKLAVSSYDSKEIKKELDKAWDNWMYEECENSILINKDRDILLQMPIEDYLTEWIVVGGFTFLDIGSEKFQNGDYFMSGTKGLLPTVFDVPPVSKNEKIHQAEKPVELLEQIIEFVSNSGEKLLDQFAGSGVLGEAAFNTGRESILIEKDSDIYEKAVNRVKKTSR